MSVREEVAWGWGEGGGRMKSPWEDDGISAFRDEIAASGEEGEMVTRAASLSASTVGMEGEYRYVRL